MINKNKDLFILNTADTSYIIKATESGQLLHLYYGKKIRVMNTQPSGLYVPAQFPGGNLNCYDDAHKNLCLEKEPMEVSSFGKGDIREPFCEIIFEDGSYSVDFVYEGYSIDKDKPEKSAMPAPRTDASTDHLRIVLKERNHDIKLLLDYYVFYNENTIVRSSKLENGIYKVRVRRLMSAQFDMLMDKRMLFTTFTGAWAREMHKNVMEVKAGKLVNSSYAGVSSNRANPYVMLSEAAATEDTGNCYGFNLIYSGNHYSCVEKSEHGLIRFVNGINPQSFSYILDPGESFTAPCAVMSFSSEGFNGLSRNMHDFIRNFILPERFAGKRKPVLLNSWEAAYFNISEKKLLGLAKSAAKAGIELFVVDDGWFGDRSDDTKALGDWHVNRDKFPSGLKGFGDKLKEMGLRFGIWLEPEMVNVNSNLYSRHPEWTIDIPDQPHSEGRNQRILDLSRKDVCAYIVKTVKRILSSADISYVKWDMNRIFSDIYSKALPSGNQEEVIYRYYRGLYSCLKQIRKEFPDVIFEGCCAGGNRFDLGMLTVFDQIWASDNTDALCRAEMVYNLSYGYPLCAIGSHVSSSPNHQTLRRTGIHTRADVNMFGNLGYELNLRDASKDDLEAIKLQIERFKESADMILYGDLYRSRCFGMEFPEVLSSSKTSALSSVDNILEFNVVSKDRLKSVALFMQRLAVPNYTYASIAPKGLDPDRIYKVFNYASKINIKVFGDLINTASPVHIKDESHTQEIISRFYKMNGEELNVNAYGSMIMNCGIRLKPAFAATGFNDEVRLMRDFESRIYYLLS